MGVKESQARVMEERVLGLEEFPVLVVEEESLVSWV